MDAVYDSTLQAFPTDAFEYEVLCVTDTVVGPNDNVTMEPMTQSWYVCNFGQEQLLSLQSQHCPKSTHVALVAVMVSCPESCGIVAARVMESGVTLEHHVFTQFSGYDEFERINHATVVFDTRQQWKCKYDPDDARRIFVDVVLTNQSKGPVEVGRVEVSYLFVPMNCIVKSRSTFLGCVEELRDMALPFTLCAVEKSAVQKIATYALDGSVPCICADEVCSMNVPSKFFTNPRVCSPHALGKTCDTSCYGIPPGWDVLHIAPYCNPAVAPRRMPACMLYDVLAGLNGVRIVNSGHNRQASSLIVPKWWSVLRDIRISKA
jgi:hypothetical protein